MAYISYHLWRFRQYWRASSRQFKKDILSSKLVSQLSLIISALMLLSYPISQDTAYLQASALFLCYGILTHIYRDYRKGYHIGWARSQLKRKSIKEAGS